ncbi:MAG: WD40 repeat domain-containing protein, partial [Planctomycetota bacterium]
IQISKLLPLALDHPQASAPFSLDLDDRGELLVTGSVDGRLVLSDLNPRGRRVQIETAESERVWKVAVAPDASHVAALWHSGILKLWETSLDSGGEAKQIAELAVFEQATRYRYPFGAMLKFSARGDRLFASGGGHGSVLLDTGGEVLTRLDPPGGNFFSVTAAWSTKGDRLFFARGKELLVLRAEDGAAIDSFELPHEIKSLAVDADPAVLWVGGDSKEIGRFELDGGSYSRVAEPSGAQLHFETPQIAAIHRSAESDRLAYSTATSAFVEVLTADADVIWTSDFLGGRMGEPVEVLLSPNGRWLWYAWKSGAIRSGVVDLESGQEFRTPIWTRSPKLAGSRVVWLAGRGVVAFDAESGRELWHRIDLEN